MKQLVEFDLTDHSSILIEVDEPKLPGPNPTAHPGEIAIKAQKTLESALDSLSPMFEVLKHKFDEMNTPADEVEVKFGLKLSGQCGAIITAGAEASYEITLKWKTQ